MIQFVSDTESLPQALGKTLGTGDDDGDQDVIDKFLRVRQENHALPLIQRELLDKKCWTLSVAAIHVVLHSFLQC